MPIGLMYVLNNMGDPTMTGIQEGRSQRLERPMKISLIGFLIGIAVFVVAMSLIDDDILTGWTCAVSGVFLLLSGVVAIGAQSRWRWAVLLFDLTLACFMGLVAYVFVVQW
jgi:hypothetical protein